MKTIIKKSVVILLIGALLMATVWAAPQETTENNSQITIVTAPEEKKPKLPQAVEDGKQFGELDGNLAGKRDYVNGLKSDYRKAMLKRNQLIKKFGLKTYSSEDMNYFLDAYEESFKEAYRKAMSEQLLEQYFSPATRGEKSGTDLGTAEGIASANIDILNNDKSDWLRAYNNFIKKSDLRTRYQLNLHEVGYGEAFELSFKTSFKSAYRQHFDDFIAGVALNNTTYHLVKYNEDTVIYDKLYSQVDNGSESSGSESTASLSIEQGTVYQDTYISLQRAKNVTLVKNGDYDAASGVYQITIQNDRDGIKLYKPMKLKFIYNDDPNIGVYKWKYNRWCYVATQHEDDGVSIEIPAGTYHGGKYALFIDEKFVIPADSVFSWAYDDIVLAMKRNYISNATNYRPDASITRFEMASIIYHVMYMRKNHSVTRVDMIDRDSISYNPAPVDFVINLGYLTLDENGAFNPNRYVKYSDFTVIMQRLTGNQAFDYGEVAQKMFYEHYTMSNYLNDKNGNPTRAEVIYTINEYLD